MPWQQHVADVALEIDPATGQLFYEEVVITVPRQSGKTTLLLALMTWRCLLMARRLDLPQTVTYLAQSGKMARRKLEREFIPVLRKAKGFTEVPHSRARPTKPTEFKPSMNNGSEHILFGTGSYLQIEAPTGTGSHGDVLDMPVIDEAFAREDDLVEQAVDAATVTRTSPQTFIISTAGNERSSFLWRKVLGGRSASTKGHETKTAFFDWSVPDDEPYDDPEVWCRYLPALGHTITVERLQARLDKALRNPDEVDEEGYEPGLAGFRRGYLNQWVKTPQLGVEQVQTEIDPAVWMGPEILDRNSQIIGPVVLGVGVGLDGVSAAMVIAGRRVDGLVHLETFERAQGVWWLERRLRDWVEQQQPVVVAWDHGGPTRAVSPDIQRACAIGNTKAVPMTGREWSGACEAFGHAVKERRVRHMGDVLLRDAINGAFRREVGSGWVWDLRSARSDITPLLAATAALRALETLPTEPAFVGGFVDLNEFFNDDDD
jgi:phage terminase large subunit-like protein